MCSSGRWRASRTPRSIASRYKAPRPESTARFLDSWLKLIGKMIRRTAWVNLRVKGVMGQNYPPTAGLASRDGCQGQARARERGLNRHQGPRPGDSNDRTRNCPPPQEMATLYHRERARQHRWWKQIQTERKKIVGENSPISPTPANSSVIPEKQVNQQDSPPKLNEAKSNQANHRGACFSGFRGRARPDQGSAGILPRTRWFHPPSWAAGAFGRSARSISSSVRVTSQP